MNRGFAVIGLVVLVGCGSDPIAPTVSVVSQAPSSLILGVDEEDDVSLRLGYEDGDGDIGGGVVHVHDCRDSSLSLDLPIPVVASPEIVEQKQKLTGELIVLIPDISAASAEAPPAICAELGVSAASDELVMCVTIEDSAGQSSAGACSAPFQLISP